MNVDANKIIEKLSLKLAQKEAQIAVLEAQVESLMDAQTDENETKEDE